MNEILNSSLLLLTPPHPPQPSSTLLTPLFFFFFCEKLFLINILFIFSFYVQAHLGKI